MVHSKLAELLQSFDEAEWRSCHKYLKYTSKRNAVSLRLFEYFFKHRNKKRSDHFSRDRILKKVYPDQSVKFLLNAASQLSMDIESFFIHQHLLKRDQRYERKLTLAKIYKSKGLYNSFERTINELKKECDSSSDLDLFYNFKKLQIHHLHYFSESYSKFVRPYPALIQAENELSAFTKNLNYFYKIEKEHTQDLMEINAAPSVQQLNTDLTELLDHLHRVNKNHDPESELFLTAILKDEASRLSEELTETILITLINECIYQTKLGSARHRQQMAALYIYGLESGILLNNGKLSEKRFLNIIDALSKSDLLVNRSDFIDEWMQTVETPDKVSLGNIANALWLFAIDEYEEALYNIEIIDTKLTDLNLSVRARWIKVCSLCSLYPEYQDKLEVLEAARLFFMRHKKEMTRQTFIASNNLLKMVRLIWDKRPMPELTQFLEKNTVIVQRHWIEKQLN